MLTRELIRARGARKTIVIDSDSVIKVQLNYSTGFRRRLSKTSIYLRLGTNVTPTDLAGSALRVGPWTINPSSEDPGEVFLSIDSNDLGKILYDNLVNPMTSIQSSEVVYKSVDILTHVNMKWEPEGFALNGSNLIVCELYRFKCGSNLSGVLDVGTHISDQSLVFSLYGVGLPSTYSKPSRFLVQGTYFQTDTETRVSPAVAKIEEVLNSVIEEKDTKGHTVSLAPLSDIYGAFRQIEVAQLEGLRKLPGSSK